MDDVIANLRYKAAQWMYRKLMGPVGGTLPSEGIRSLQESMYQEDVQRHIDTIVELSPPEVVHFDFPESFPPWFRREKTFDRRNLYELSDLYVSPRSGLMWLPHGPVVEESVGSLRRIMGWQAATKDTLLSSRDLEVDGPLIVCPSLGYFHWVFEELPRILYAADNEPSARLLLYRDSPSYVLESLREGLGTEYVSNAVVASGPVRVPSVVLVGADPYSGFIAPRDLKRLRDTFSISTDSSHYERDSGRTSLYVSRRGTSRRKMDRERELERELQKRGVLVIQAEDYSFVEQVRLFRDADLVIGPHGAGLSNIVWGQKAKLLEIFPYTEFNDCYARIASTLNFKYEYVYSEDNGTLFGSMPIGDVLPYI